MDDHSYYAHGPGGCVCSIFNITGNYEANKGVYVNLEVPALHMFSQGGVTSNCYNIHWK